MKSRRTKSGKADLDLARLPLMEPDDYGKSERAERVPSPFDPDLPYGPETVRVRAIIDALPNLDRVQMRNMAAVVKSTKRRTYRVQRPSAKIVKAVQATGRRPEFLGAWWDAARAGIRQWCDPMFPMYFWNDWGHGNATECAMLAASAQVVADRIAPSLLASAQAPWRAAFDGLPAGLLGPHHATIEAMAARFALLDVPQALAMADAWHEATGGQPTVPLGLARPICQAANPALLDLVAGLATSPRVPRSARPGRNLGVETYYPVLTALLAVAFVDVLPDDLREVSMAGWIEISRLDHEQVALDLG